MVDIEKAFFDYFPNATKYPKWTLQPLIYILRKLFHEDEVNTELKNIGHLEGFEFIEAVLEYFNVTYSASAKEKLNIPPTGRVVMIANHPLGALDALCLILLIREVRQDIKVVANELLMLFPQLRSWIIPVDAMKGHSKKDNIKDIYKALHNEQAVIMFPSGEVSRARPTGVRDTRWNKGFLTFAKKTGSPILPIYIRARNSGLFYTVSMIHKPLAALLLPHEMFKKKDATIGYRIGEIIPYKSIAESPIVNDKQAVSLIQKHLYRIGKGKKGIFKTENCIAHPENPKDLRQELNNAELLGQTNDGKHIFIFDYFPESSVMREVGRLREFTFRKVEEGTGGKRDIDRYDEYYRHIILWDDTDLEIVGAYRLGESEHILKHYGKDGFYSHSLFEFEESFKPYLSNSIELGRSFVQPKYWGSRALDYLWQGIGSYLYKNKDIRYLFGPVSLSNSYPKVSKNMILHFYHLYFASPVSLVTPKEPFIINKNEMTELKRVFDGNNYKEDFKKLKRLLASMSLTIPTLYKQYSDLCEKDGIYFAGFNIDHEFADCVDSFIIADIDKIKESKKERYIQRPDSKKQ